MRLSIILWLSLVLSSAFGASQTTSVGILAPEGRPGHADGIIQALELAPAIAPVRITNATPEILAGFRVVVWPQMPLGLDKQAPAYQAYERWASAVKQWVEDGGGLLVTHDAPGYRNHPALFPEIAVGISHEIITHLPFEEELVIARAAPPAASFNQGDRIPLSFNDYVVLMLGAQGRVLARGVKKTGDMASSAGPAIVYGRPGSGRYIANGALPGLLAGCGIAPPSGAERQLLLDNIAWLAGQSDDAESDAADFGPGLNLGGQAVNLLFNGSFENSDRGRPPAHIRPYHANGAILPRWGVTNSGAHTGGHCAWLEAAAFNPADPAAVKGGSVGIVFGDALHGTRGASAYVIPDLAAEYEFSVWLKGDPDNTSPPIARVSALVWRLADGQWQRKVIIPHNEAFDVTAEWRKHTVRFPVDAGYSRMALNVFMAGAPGGLKPKSGHGAPVPGSDLPVGTKIYLDDAVLCRLQEVAEFVPADIRTQDDRHVDVQWRDDAGPPPPLQKVMFGDDIEPPSEMVDIPDYNPWPATWTITDLSGTWKIKKLPGTESNPADDEGTAQGFWRADYDPADWEEIAVPDFWGPESGVGWYQTRFDLPAPPARRPVILHFGRAHYEATVYLNGRRIGVHRGGNRPFEFDVTRAAVAGANVLAVRVFRQDDKQRKYMNAIRGGIMGRVTLQIRPEIYAAGMLIDPCLAASNFAVRAELMNTSDHDRELDLAMDVAPSVANRRLKGPLGQTQRVALGRHVLRPGLNALAFTIALDRPVAWSPDYPHLYTLGLSAGGEQAGQERVGFREFTTRDNYYMLNGKPFMPMGLVFNHRNFLDAMDVWHNQSNIMRRIMAAHREWGVNMIFPQGAHLSYPRLFYDICDELGIMVNEWQGTTAQALIKDRALLDDDDTIQRLRFLYNHPAFVMYTIGNESRHKEFVGPINHVYDLVKNFDGQKRPVCAVSGGVPSTLRFKEDVVDIHYYPGMIAGHPLDTGEMFENVAADVWRAHGKLLPLGNWELGGGKVVIDGAQFKLGRELFSANPLDREALVRGIVQADPGYSMPLGLRWLTLYGLRRYLVDDYARAAGDPDFTGKKISKAGWPMFVAKYYNQWLVKQCIESCRRLGGLMRGGFGINLGRTYSLFYVRDPNGRLRAGDQLLEDFKGFPWFAPTRLRDGTLAASELYSNYKRVYSPRFICADVFDKNRFAGGVLRLNVYAINDTQSDSTPWDARVAILDRQGAVLCDQRATLGVAGAMQRHIAKFEYAIPEKLQKGFYDIHMYLMADGRVISDNYYDFFVLNAGDLDARIDARRRRVAVYDVSRQAVTSAGILKELEVQFDPVAGFDRLNEYDVLIIGAESLDNNIAAHGAQINDWVKAGGRLLQFEQYVSGSLGWLPQMSVITRYGGNLGNVVVPEHPVFDKISASGNWETWSGRLERSSRGGKQGGIFTALLSPLNKTMLAVGCQATPRAEDTAAQMLIADVKVGRGQALISQAAATFRYGVDSVATKYIQNCIKYILSDETRFAEPISGLTIMNVDARRCGYLDFGTMSQHAIAADAAWLDALRQGLKTCGGLRFNLTRPRAALLTAPARFAPADAMQYMEPAWEAEKQATDKDQGALLRDRWDTLYIMAGLPEPAPASAAAARLKIVYRDGVAESRDLIAGRDIAGTDAAVDLENAIYVGAGFHVIEWKNPRAEAPVDALIVEPLGDRDLILGGITATLVRDKVHGL